MSSDQGVLRYMKKRRTGHCGFFLTTIPSLFSQVISGLLEIARGGVKYEQSKGIVSNHRVWGQAEFS